MTNPLYVNELERKVQQLQQELDEIKSVEFPRRVEKVAEGWRGKCEHLQEYLEASQAREVQLRETFKWIEKNATSPEDTWYLAQATRALAWLRSQGEPVGYTTQLAIRLGHFTSNPKNLWGDKGVPLFLAPQPAIPDGWQLVPQEPTRAMYKAAMKESDDKWIAEPKLYVAYRAMIAAAPEYNQGEVK